MHIFAVLAASWIGSHCLSSNAYAHAAHLACFTWALFILASAFPQFAYMLCVQFYFQPTWLARLKGPIKDQQANKRGNDHGHSCLPAAQKANWFRIG